MKVSSIHIYPIKGMRGVSVGSAQAEHRGFVNDRRYMLIDSNNQFVSQRTHPRLTQLTPQIHEDVLVVRYQQQSVDFMLDEMSDVRVTAQLFEHTVPGRLVSQEVDAWFSAILEEPVRLIKMATDDFRYKKLIKGPERTEVSYADGYPYLVAGTASLETLNSQLDVAVLMDRFRPNLVVDTEAPHAEDSWSSLSVGSARFMVIKPCARCPVVNIDQASGTRSKDVLKALSTYRKIDNKVYFGANSICSREGSVAVGDSIGLID